jgi:hypothetical protein
MPKPFTWDEVRQQLAVELQQTSHILTYGTIGSCNIEHDIDTIVTKKVESPSADFFRELHEVFDRLDAYLQNHYQARLIRTSRFSDEEETKYIANYQENDVVFQVLSYVSMKQIKMHWFDSFIDLDGDVRIEPFLRDNYKCIAGHIDDIFRSDFASHRREDLFIRLNDSDRINSHFPKDFLVHRMNVLYDFVSRKRLGIEMLPAADESECRDRFYKICTILDQ